MFRALSEKYGWTPYEIGKMTKGQIDMYLESDEPAPADEARATATAPTQPAPAGAIVITDNEQAQHLYQQDIQNMIRDHKEGKDGVRPGTGLS